MRYILLICTAIIASIPLMAQEDKPDAAANPPADAAAPADTSTLTPPGNPPGKAPEKPKNDIDWTKRLIDDDGTRVDTLEKEYEEFKKNPRATNNDIIQKRAKDFWKKLRINIRKAHNKITLKNLENPKPPETKKPEEPSTGGDNAAKGGDKATKEESNTPKEEGNAAKEE